MITRRNRLAATAALTVLALTSCDNKQEAVPTTTTQPAPTTPASSRATAPTVAKPLDAGDFVANPCTSLTEAQQRQYGITHVQHQSPPETEGETCEFSGTDDTSFSAEYHTEIPNGLDFRYQQKGRGAWRYWKPTVLDGYPAVAYGNTDPPQYCIFEVGVSNSLTFSVMYDNTCTESRSVASTILANIKAAN